MDIPTSEIHKMSIEEFDTGKLLINAARQRDQRLRHHGQRAGDDESDQQEGADETEQRRGAGNAGNQQDRVLFMLFHRARRRQGELLKLG